MKAYIVDDGDHLAVEYLDDYVPPELHFCDYSRAEWADEYAPNGPPASAWLDNGYWIECGYCDHHVRNGGCDDCQDEHEDIDGPVFDGDFVFCSTTCKEESDKDVAKRKQRKAEARQEFAKKFPYARVTNDWIGGVSQCECFRKDHCNACLHWTVPGATQGDHANSYCGGCKRAWVCQGDLEAIRKAKEGVK